VKNHVHNALEKLHLENRSRLPRTSSARWAAGPTRPPDAGDGLRRHAPDDGALAAGTTTGLSRRASDP
jgi:hypothetical protein